MKWPRRRKLPEQPSAREIPREWRYGSHIQTNPNGIGEFKVPATSFYPVSLEVSPSTDSRLHAEVLSFDWNLDRPLAMVKITNIYGEPIVNRSVYLYYRTTELELPAVEWEPSEPDPMRLEKSSYE